jgi:hypothetical protein
MEDVGKKLAFMAIAGAVGAIVAAFLQPPPGMDTWVVFIGTGAAIAGSAIGIVAHKAPDLWKVVFVLIAVVVLVFAVNGYRGISGGEPGSAAANLLLYWVAAIFLTIGLLIELAGLKMTSAAK